MKFFSLLLFSFFFSTSYSFSCESIASSEAGELIFCQEAQLMEFSPAGSNVEKNLIIRDVTTFTGVAVYNDNIALQYQTSSSEDQVITIVYRFSENRIVFTSLDPKSYNNLNELERFMLKQLNR